MILEQFGWLRSFLENSIFHLLGKHVCLCGRWHLGHEGTCVMCQGSGSQYFSVSPKNNISDLKTWFALIFKLGTVMTGLFLRKRLRASLNRLP